MPRSGVPCNAVHWNVPLRDKAAGLKEDAHRTASTKEGAHEATCGPKRGRRLPRWPKRFEENPWACGQVRRGGARCQASRPLARPGSRATHTTVAKHLSRLVCVCLTLCACVFSSGLRLSANIKPPSAPHAVPLRICSHALHFAECLCNLMFSMMFSCGART